MSPETSLAEILAGHMRAGQPIAVPVTLAIVRQICDALDYVHNLRDPAGQPLWIVHGDVSPAHIFISNSGLARLVPRMTPQGTCAYLAPEYVMTGMIDARADLFALGVVAYEMLANRPLFASGDDRETLQRVCALVIPPPSTFNPLVPPDIDGIVLTALARDPAYRWPHAAMMRDGLQSVTQRLGLELVRANDAPPPAPQAAFVSAPAPEPQVAPVSAPPPSNLWDDDDDLATRIKPVDPALLDDVPDLVAPVARARPDDVPDLVAPVARARPDDVPDLVAPVARARPDDVPDLVAPVARARPDDVPDLVAPVAKKPAPAPAPAFAPKPAPAPAPAAASAPAAAPAARPPSNAFDPDLGPEPTQIGAMPLISLSGDAPLIALVGENAPRPLSRSLPPPVATFLPEPESRHRSKHLALVAILVVVAIAVVVLVVL